MITEPDVAQAADAAWDEFLTTTPGGSHKQTSAWARLKASQGWRSERALVRDAEGRVVAGAQLLLKELPVAAWAGQIAYVVKGPIVAPGPTATATATATATMDRILDEVQLVCRRNGVRVLIVQPPEHMAPIESLLERRGYLPSPLSLAPTSTVLTDLTPGADAIWSSLSKNLRHNIRRAESKGLAVRMGDRSDLEAFHDLLQIASTRLRYAVFPLSYYRRMWDEFEPSDGIQLFLAELGDELVSAHLCLTFGGTIFLKALAWSGEHVSLNANNPLTWNIIRWGADHGLRWYDPEGIPDDLARKLLDGDHPATLDMKGAHAYKLKWPHHVAMFPQPRLFVTNRALRTALRAVPEQHQTRLMRDLRSRFRPVGAT